MGKVLCSDVTKMELFLDFFIDLSVLCRKNWETDGVSNMSPTVSVNEGKTPSESQNYTKVQIVTGITIQFASYCSALLCPHDNIS